MKYDLIIIGAGSGGFASAIQANELGLKTLIINYGLAVGGTCVNVGCVPSKALIHYAKNKNLDFHEAIEVNNQKFQAEKIIIANGSTANVPEIKGIKEVGYLTHITAPSNKKLPPSIAITGAGPLGWEFSQIYSRFG